MDIQKLYDVFRESAGICTDTRMLKTNQVFFALKGPNFNGNDYVQTALKLGALAVVSDDDSVVENDRVIQVSDSLVALQDLARRHRNFMSAKVIAITGSNGKTTTKELFKAVLSQKFKVQATIGNLNNHIGVPLTILRLKNDTEILILEMGANHQNEIALLTSIGLPDLGIITNIGKAHLEGFGGIEGVRKGKGELFDDLKARNKLIIFNAIDEEIVNLVNDYEKSLAYYPGQYVNDTDEIKSGGLSFKYLGRTHWTNLVGKYNISNVAAAICVGEYFDVDSESIKKAISTYVPDNNRSQEKMLNGVTYILDAYNANPDSMRSSLSSFFEAKKYDNKVVVLGDMLELGSYSKEEHLDILEYIKVQDELKKVILVGPHFGQFKESFPFQFYEDVDSLREDWRSFEFLNHSILLKGSRGIKLEKIMEL